MSVCVCVCVMHERFLGLLSFWGGGRGRGTSSSLTFAFVVLFRHIILLFSLQQKAL